MSVDYQSRWEAFGTMKSMLYDSRKWQETKAPVWLSRSPSEVPQGRWLAGLVLELSVTSSTLSATETTRKNLLWGPWPLLAACWSFECAGVINRPQSVHLQT